MSAPRPDGLFTVDVEEYFQVEAFASTVSPDSWPTLPSRVEIGTRRVLDLLERHATHATFFVVGWVAERQKALVREIVERGHEIACHGYWHRAIYRMAPDEFREDLRRARTAIESAAGVAVRGYRAPTWSVTAKTLWALEILADEGFAYDSSVFPIRHDLYGIPGAPRAPHEHTLASGRRLPEFPPTTVRVAGMTLPAAGGGYLRLLPLAYSRWALRRVRQNDAAPGMVYVHPWELDPEQPRMAAPALSRLRHYTNLDKTEERLDALLREHRFGPIAAWLDAAEQPAP